MDFTCGICSGHKGRNAVLGISSQECPLQALGYKVLVEGDSQSWGWELTTDRLWHAGQNLGAYPERNKKWNYEHGNDFRLQSPT